MLFPNTNLDARYIATLFCGPAVGPGFGILQASYGCLDHGFSQHSLLSQYNKGLKTLFGTLLFDASVGGPADVPAKLRL